MSSVFPGALDNFPVDHVDNVGEFIEAEFVNRLEDAVNKIEAELGVIPSAAYATVAARIAAVEAVGSGGVDGTSYANGQHFYVSSSGNDTTGDGKMWGTAYRQISKALAVSTHGATIHVGTGSYSPFTIASLFVKIIGSDPSNGGTIILADTNTADCITIGTTGIGAQLYNIQTRGNGAAFTGRGIWLKTATIRVENWTHFNGEIAASATIGGTAVYLSNNSEQNYFVRCGISQASKAIHANSASMCTFINCNLTGNYQDVILDEQAGGFCFTNVKAVTAPAGTQNVVDIQSGNNTFINCDFDESLGGPQNTLVAGDGNTFINCGTSPQNCLRVDGDSNLFIGHVLLTTNQTILNGSKNHFLHPNGPAYGITGTGTNNVIEDPHGNGWHVDNAIAICRLSSARGTSTIPSGSTSVTVTHPWGGQFTYTPLASQIQVTSTNNPTNDPGYIWVDTITGTTFRANCNADPGSSGLTFSWSIF